jgi:hypothetical protein
MMYFQDIKLSLTFFLHHLRHLRPCHHTEDQDSILQEPTDFSLSQAYAYGFKRPCPKLVL